ncbi:MAG: 4Fe-4S dicluster domain-containing protein [Thermoleophilia bacterium]
MRIVAIDPDSCVACRNCEYACAFQQAGDFDRARAHIRVAYYPAERACVPFTCMQCAEAWCMEVCPAAAIARNEETGAVEIDAARCAGCKMCLLACPFGNIGFDEAHGVSGKCDLCGGDPRCVGSCISGALEYVEVEDAFAFRRQALDARLRHVLRLDKGRL